MKKTLFAWLLVCAIILTGCSGDSDSSDDAQTWKPDLASTELKPYAERAIEIIEEYLDFDLSVKEATEEFSNLADRMESLGVTDEDSEYSDTDKIIAHKIERLSIRDADFYSDLEYQQIRDVLAFQIGENVSGKTYDPELEKNIFDGEAVPKALRLFDAPSSHASATQLEDAYFIYLIFDSMNGVDPEDLLGYTEKVIGILQESTENSFTSSVMISYECYEQHVFTLMVTLDEDSFGGVLYSSKEDLLVQIKSEKDLSSALNKAVDYVD